MEVRQPDALAVKAVEIRRADNGIAVTAQFPVALIVRQDEDDVGRFGGVGLGHRSMRNYHAGDEPYTGPAGRNSGEENHRQRQAKYPGDAQH
jgi:hypothetical protein